MMIFTIIAALVMLALLDISLRVDYVDRLKLKTRFGLFALRDKLRLAAIEGTLPDNELFDYLDTTFSRTIDYLDHVNVWEALAFVAYYRNDPQIKAAQKWLNKEFNRKENREFSQFYKGYIEVLARLLYNRHSTLRVAFLASAVVASSLSKLKKETIEIFGRVPETSTLKRTYLATKAA